MMNSRNQKKVSVRDGQSSYCEACLYKVGHSEEFHSSGAVHVKIPLSRVSVELKANGLVYEDGTAFSGNAKMEVFVQNNQDDLLLEKNIECTRFVIEELSDMVGKENIRVE